MEGANMSEQNNGFEKTIGNTRYIVTIKQSDTAKKSLDEKYKDICTHAVLGDFTGEKINFDELQETS